MPLLKYKTYIDIINSEREAYDNIGICPCEEAISKEILAFRFVFENMDNPNNFIPKSIKAIQQDKQPRRFPKTPVFYVMDLVYLCIFQKSLQKQLGMVYRYILVITWHTNR